MRMAYLSSSSLFCLNSVRCQSICQMGPRCYRTSILSSSLKSRGWPHTLIAHHLSSSTVLIRHPHYAHRLCTPSTLLPPLSYADHTSSTVLIHCRHSHVYREIQLELYTFICDVCRHHSRLPAFQFRFNGLNGHCPCNTGINCLEVVTLQE